jgi:small subunit ribosomal protein S18
MNNQENNFNNNENNEESFLKVSLVNQSVFIRKRKVCPLRDIPLSEINYTNLKLLNKFLTERGKIIASRISNVEIKKQRAIAKAIKIARQLGLISPIAKESN